MKSNGAVVRTEDLVIDGGVLNLRSQPVGDQEVVDTPAGVVLPGFEHIAPSGVSTHSIGIQMAEGVGEAAV